MDECGLIKEIDCNIPITIRRTEKSGQYVLGDHQQLPPVIKQPPLQSVIKKPDPVLSASLLEVIKRIINLYK